MTDGAECNDPVASADVTVMRIAKSKIGTAFAIAALTASAGVAVSQGTSSADPAAGHQVHYSLTTAAGADFDLYYLTTQPASKAAYNADSYSYLKKETVSLAPGQPWTFERRDVETDYEEGNTAIIRSGLKPGERVIVKGGVIFND